MKTKEIYVKIKEISVKTTLIKNLLSINNRKIYFSSYNKDYKKKNSLDVFRKKSIKDLKSFLKVGFEFFR